MVLFPNSISWVQLMVPRTIVNCLPNTYWLAPSEWNHCSKDIMFLFSFHYCSYHFLAIAWLQVVFYSRQLRAQFSSVQPLCHVQLFVTPWIAARQASLSSTNSWSSLKLMSIESVMPSSHLILCGPLLLLPPIPPSIRVFPNESTLHMRWPKYSSFSLSISPSNEHPGLISFRMDWLDLLAVQGTLQHHIQKHQFFVTQLSSQSNSHIHTWPQEKP